MQIGITKLFLVLQNTYFNTFQLDDSGKIQLLKQLDYESNTTVYDLDVVLKVNYYFVLFNN